MKSVLLYNTNDLRLVDVLIPEVGPDEVLVQVSKCGVCRTDLRKYHTGDNGALKLPMNLGHEWVGRVVEVGPEVNDYQPGMRVVGDTYAGYAEYAVLTAQDRQLAFPDGPLLIPDTLSDEALTFVEPLSCCLHAVVNQAQLQASQTVIICGAGQMGLQMVALAHHYGARVIVSEPVAMRRELAAEFGAAHLIDPTQEDAVKTVKELTNDEGADVVILTIGLPELVNHILQMARPLGRVVMFAGFERPAKVEIDPNIIHYNELVLTGSYWLSPPPYHRPQIYQQAVDFIAKGIVPVERLMTKHFRLEQLHEAFAAASDGRSLKIIITIGE